MKGRDDEDGPPGCLSAIVIHESGGVIVWSCFTRKCGPPFTKVMAIWMVSIIYTIAILLCGTTFIKSV